MRCDEAQELITARVDNELGVEERASIDAHLKSCAACAWTFEQESLLKRRIRLSAQQISAPMALRRLIEENSAAAKPVKKLWRGWKLPGRFAAPRRRRNEGKSASSAAAKTRRKFFDESALPRLRGALVAGLLLVIAGSVIYNQRRVEPPKNLALAAVDTHLSILSGKTTLLRAVNLAAMRNELAYAVGNRFRPVVLDLSLMNYHAIAGFVQNFDGRDVLVTVYHGDGPPITCFTFLGSEADAPQGAERFYDSEMKVNFYSFSLGDLNGVLHEEGQVYCLLVSKMAPADLMALLRGKSKHA